MCRLFVSLTLVLAIFGLRPGILSARQVEPQPNLQIDSLVFDSEANIYRVMLNLTTTREMSSLRLQITNQRNGQRVFEDILPLPALGEIQFEAADLVPDDEYRLLIRAEDLAGRPMTAEVEARDEIINVPVEAEYEFRHEPPIREASVVIESLQVERDPSTLLIMLNVTNPDDVGSYEVSLRNEGNIQQSSHVFPMPVSNPLAYPLENAPTGEYTVVVNARNRGGEILTTATDEIEYTAQNINLFQQIQGNPILLGVIVVLVVALIIILFVSSRQPKATAYRPQASPAYRRSDDPNFLAEQDRSIARLEDSQMQQLRSRSRSQQKRAALRILRPVMSMPEIDIRKSPFTIGRNPDQDLSLPQCQGISGSHAQIEIVGDSFFVRDHNSTNGTTVESAATSDVHRVTSRHELASGDVIRLGRDVKITFTIL